MMKNLLIPFLALFLFIGLSSSAFASDAYYIDDKAVDQLIEQATPISFNDFNLDINQSADAAAKKNAFVAWALTYSIVGLHRVYLGTSTTTFVAYACTLGGFLILDIVDFALLLVAIIDNKSIDKYTNNDHLFMWNE